MDFSKVNDLVRKEVLCIILIEFGILLKLVRVIKMRLNENHNRARVGNHLSDKFPVKNGLKQGDALLPLLFNFSLGYAFWEGSGKPRWLEIKWYTSASGLC
jgi:hypothetical protein